MRASFILLGPLLSRFGEVDHQQPRRRPDRPAAGGPPRRRDASPGGRDRLPLRLLLRQGARPAARRGGPVPVRSRSWGRRTRCSRRPWPRGTRSIRPAAREPEVDDLIEFLRKMGAEVERTGPDTIEIEGQPAAPRARSTAVVPDRIEAGTFAVAAAVTGGRVTPRAARRCDHLDALLEILGRDGRRRRPAAPDRHRGGRDDASGPAAYRAGRRRDRAVSRAGHGPPAADAASS